MRHASANDDHDGDQASVQGATLNLKLLLMGDSGVGKSSILLRFTEDRFQGEQVHNATIGVDFKVKFVTAEGGERIKLSIWDTAGQERFRSLTSTYYRGAHGVILVYDITSRESFVNIKNIWVPQLQRYAELGEMTLMIVANKLDKSPKEHQVSSEEGKSLAKNLSALFIECSAKTRLGITDAFDQLVQAILHSPQIAEVRRSRQVERRLHLLEQRENEGQDAGTSTGCCL